MATTINEQISDLLKKYIEIFLHPFLTHSALRRQRLERNNDVVSISQQTPIELSLEETVSISWLFALFRTFYSIVSITFGFHFLSFLNTESQFKELFLPNIQFSGQKIVVLLVLLEIVIFPVLTYVYILITTIILKFFSRLFESDSDEETIKQTISHSLSANALLIIPIFGEFLRLLISIVHLFAGLRNNFGMSRLQTSVVMISPLFMVIGAVLVNILYLTMIFSLL